MYFTTLGDNWHRLSIKNHVLGRSHGKKLLPWVSKDFYGCQILNIAIFVCADFCISQLNQMF